MTSPKVANPVSDNPVSGRRLSRSAACGAIVAILGSIAVDTMRQNGNNAMRVSLILIACAVGFVGWRYRNSSAIATSFVGLTIMWALSQDAESATEAVVVGAFLTVAVVLLSWLAQPPVDISSEGVVRRGLLLVSLIAGFSAVGLLVLQFVDRPPASRMVVLFGIAAVAATLGLLYAFGEVEKEPVS